MSHDSSATGGCACGAVRFATRGQPYRVGLCHCFDCRKQHGAPFGAFAIFPAEQVTLSGDTAGIYASSERGRRHFCRRCGSPVFNSDMGSDEIELCVGAFDTVDLFAPTYELWACRREAWLPDLPSVRHRYERDRTGPQRTED